jgi:nucleoside-diphosphate-sugar epimerase
MRVFLAGASGVIGSCLVPLLTTAGHQVTAMTRSPGKVQHLTRAGATPVVCNVFDVEALKAAVDLARPDLIMNQLTDLPDDAKAIPEHSASHNRIRREGTRNLLAAASASGVGQISAQSVAWELPGDGAAAVAEMEEMVLGFPGLVMRYGQFYGPGTYHPDVPPPPPRIHIDEAAIRTASLLEQISGVVTVTEL